MARILGQQLGARAGQDRLWALGIGVLGMDLMAIRLRLTCNFCIETQPPRLEPTIDSWRTSEGGRMDPVTASAAAAAITPYLVRTAEALGDKLFDRIADPIADDTVAFGRRILRRLFCSERPDPGHPSEAVKLDPHSSKTDLWRTTLELAKTPHDVAAQDAARTALQQALLADPELLAELQDLLASADRPGRVTASGERSVAIGRDNHGSVSTG